MTVSAQAKKNALTTEMSVSEIDDLAAFLVLSNRISSRLESATAVPGSETSLADWLLMYAIRNGDAASMADVARTIGVSRQRVHQQASQLQSAGLLIVSQSEDGKSRQMSLSPAGRILIEAKRKNLEQTIASKESFAAQMQNARRSAARIAKALAPAEASA